MKYVIILDGIIYRVKDKLAEKAYRISTTLSETDEEVEKCIYGIERECVRVGDVVANLRL